jgi:hypothetical protein
MEKADVFLITFFFKQADGFKQSVCLRVRSKLWNKLHKLRKADEAPTRPRPAKKRESRIGGRQKRRKELPRSHGHRWEIESRCIPARGAWRAAMAFHLVQNLSVFFVVLFFPSLLLLCPRLCLSVCSRV